MQGETSIAQLERHLDELARRFERFFGRDPHVATPPEPERVRFERRLQELSREEGRSTAEQFRLEQLQHRLSTLNQLWRRQLREREEAPGRAPAVNAGGAAPVDSAKDEAEALFHEYTSQLGRSGAPARVTLDAFRRALEGQRQKLEEQGLEVERFEVVGSGTDVKVRARARRRRQG